MALNIHLACGGTGGHIFPGLATAEVLRSRGHRVSLWMAGKDVEASAVRGWDGPVITVPSEGFERVFAWRTLRTAWRLLGARRICLNRMRQERPDVLLAMGSYASVGPASAAFRLGVPVVLHEANVIPGRAVVVLAARATAVAAVFEETRFYLKRRELTITGMPLRREILESRPAAPAAPRDEGAFTVLVTGGSRGAHRLNELVVAAFTELSGAPRALHVIHLTGVADEAAVRASYAAAKVSHEVHAFSHDMGGLYRRADLVICRSGAATCAELTAYGLPALLVPFPFAARQHQLANARAMAKHGAADLVEEKDLEQDWLADYVTGMMRTPKRLRRMRAAAAALARTDAAEALATLVEASAHGNAAAGI